MLGMADTGTAKETPPIPLHAEPTAPAPPALPSLGEVLLAPWYYGFEPARAARVLVGARRWHFWIALLTGVVALGAVVLLLSARDSGPDSDEPNSILDLLALFGTMLGVVALAAGLYLPDVHRTGRVWESYCRTFRALAGAVGFITVLVLVGYVVALGGTRLGARLADPWTALVVIIGIWLTIAWAGRAVAGAQASVTDLFLPLRCEGCGYDLTHRPEGGRCTECGMDINTSLLPSVRRRRHSWRTAPCPATWLETTARVLFSPRRFYGTLVLREADLSERAFVRWHYLVIAALGAAWMFLIAVHRGEELDPETVLFVSITALLGALFCWLAHRIAALAVVSWWIARGQLPDYRWAAKVVAYETAFLWAFFAWVVAMASSFVLFQDWISQALQRRSYYMLLPVEAWVVVLGVLGLAAVWLWRFRIALHAIRWSNF